MNGERGFAKEKFYFNAAIILFVTVILIVSFIISVKNSHKTIQEIIQTCGDGTFYNSCSLNKPYYCSEDILVKNASFCGCPKGWLIKNDSCQYYNFDPNSETIHLKYMLNGKENYLDFEISARDNNYFDNMSKPYKFFTDEKASARDFRLVQINDAYQRQLLIPLLVEIQNKASSKEDQARIAISAVQNMPYGSSNETFNFMGQEMNYSRYPYEILYDGYGLCEEKTALLLFLLREIGYGTASFYYPVQNHESAGIKCHVEDSYLESGYCFVETTGPSIITDYNGNYDFGKLANPQILVTSNGISLGKNLPEYNDGKEIINLRNILDKKGRLNYFQNSGLEKLKAKYGIEKI